MAPRPTSAALGMKGRQLSRGSRILLGLDRNAARYTWTVVFILLLVGLLYLHSRDFVYLCRGTAVCLSALATGEASRSAATGAVKGAGAHPRLPRDGRDSDCHGNCPRLACSPAGKRTGSQASRVSLRNSSLRSRPPFHTSALPLKMTVISTVQQQLAIHSRDILALLSNAALGVISRAGNLIFIILVPILSFFFLKDGREMLSSVLGILAAGARRDMVERIAADLHVLLAQYMRALVLLGVVASLAYGLFFSMMGVPYGILLAAVAFPLEFIPMVGPLAGATIVLLVAGLSGSHHLLAIFVFLLAFRFLQDYVVSPQLLSAGMKLHPLLVIFGVLAGGSIAGVARLLSFGSGARYFANRLPAVVTQGPTDGGSA